MGHDGSAWQSGAWKQLRSTKGKKGAPRGNRTLVTGLKGLRPGPLDDGGERGAFHSLSIPQIEASAKISSASNAIREANFSLTASGN